MRPALLIDETSLSQTHTFTADPKVVLNEGSPAKTCV